MIIHFFLTSPVIAWSMTVTACYLLAGVAIPIQAWWTRRQQRKRDQREAEEATASVSLQAVVTLTEPEWGPRLAHSHRQSAWKAKRKAS